MSSKSLQFTLFNIILLINTACSAQNATSDFAVYWSKFREAVIEQDYNRLKGLTRFPLELRGVSDSDSPAAISAAEFSEIIPKVLAQTIYEFEGDKLIEKSVTEVITSKNTFEKELNATNVRISQLEFELINEKWLLVRAYLEEE